MTSVARSKTKSATSRQIPALVFPLRCVLLQVIHSCSPSLRMVRRNQVATSTSSFPHAACMPTGRSTTPPPSLPLEGRVLVGLFPKDRDRTGIWRSGSRR
eukprot:765283-Hanusia_phi.AAC.5